MPVEDEDVEVFNITSSVSYGTLHSNAEGIIPAGSFPVGSPGDVIELTSAYALKARLILAATPEKAIKANIVVKYLVENLYATTEPLSVDLYLIDDDNPDADMPLVASAAIGTTAAFPLQSNVTKNYRVRPITVDENLNKGSFNPDAEQPFTLQGAAARPQLLFAEYSTEGSTIAGADLYSDVVPENTWDADGSLVRAYYSGEFAANGNSKTIALIFDGTTILTKTTTQSGGAWLIEAHFIRSSSDELRITGQLTFPTGTIAETYTDDLVIDPTAPLLLILKGTSAANNDIVARYGYGETMSAPISTAVYLTGGGVLLTGGGVYLTE